MLIGRDLKKKDLLFFLTFSILIFLISACHNDVLRPNKAKDKLSLCISSDVTSLDPRYGLDGTSAIVIKMLFEGLTYIDASGKVVPGIAKSYEISADKKTYIFHLKDCRWSNGMDVTAYDFEYTWKSTINPHQKNRAVAVHNFYVLKNVEKYLRDECALHEIGIHSLDAKTLKVELENPIPYFLEAVTNSCFLPVCKFVDQTQAHWNRETGRKFVCNGPFHLKHHHCDNEVVLEKNPLFWNAEQVLLENISISIIKDTMARLYLFEKGELDWIGKPLSGLPPDACAILKKEDKISVSPSLASYWYFFNTERFPFTNEKMRLAFSYALNRKEVTDYMLQFNETPATSLVPKACGLLEEIYFEDNDPVKAQKLFKEALAEIGLKKENLPELSISYNSDEIHQNVAQIIQHQLFSVLGVKVKLKSMEWKVHYSNLVQGDFCIGGMMWQSWIRDPIYILQTFRSKFQGTNMARWESQQYQNVLNASDQEMDSVKRKDLLSIAQRIIMKEMPVMPVYFTSIAYAKSKNLQNVIVLESSQVDFRYAYFEEPLK